MRMTAFHRMSIGARLAGLALAALAAWTPVASAQGQDDRLKALERALQQDQERAEELRHKAKAIEAEIRVLGESSIAAARKAQDYETRLSGLEMQLSELKSLEADKVASLRARRAQLGGTLAALQRIALQPTDALIVAPGSPVDTVRSAMLLRVAIPAIEQRAKALRADLDELTALRRQIALQRDELAATTSALEAERGRISALIQRKSQARAATASEQKAARARAARLAAQAKDLRDLMARIGREAKERAERERAERERAERERAEREPERAPRASEAEQPTPTPAPDTTTRLALVKPDNIRPFPGARQSLVIPAWGRVVVRYGQSQGTMGGSAKGITIRARQGAQVVAPFDGQVVYAGPFRRYGQILIIEHGGRYHTLLAGLDRIDAVVGQWLLAGEPVGVLGSPRNENPELYLELRQAGQPINPLPWLATTGDKVRG